MAETVSRTDFEGAAANDPPQPTAPLMPALQDSSQSVAPLVPAHGGDFSDSDEAEREDEFSDYAEDFASDTTSLNSEITAYRFENGRRYHAYKDGAYWGPNDEKQNEQLDIAHHMFTLLLDGRLLLAPINENIQRALDVGTGTGIWAIDFADEYPSAQVIGTDLSPIQPGFVPPNLQFEIDDATEDWMYPENHFDLIHVRAMYGAIANWPAFYRNALDHLRPGGWFDQLEMSIQFTSDDGTVTDDHILAVWSKTFIEAGEKFGKTFRIAELAKGYMQQAGFQNVTEERFKIPVGQWSRDKRLKKLGMWNLVHCEQGIEGWAMALLTRVMGWSYPEVQVFLVEMRKGLRDPNTHAYFNVVGVYGQKPMSAY
ncbi:methyltransferase family protein [Aspergillus sclerotioniger CBS 115572]|uniref:Methyltransferase family protein n=1 Tax=Aspergillus sclerotioniger CBS 115572 TaxID=1450535 RepID=A0A317X8J4_9EURO|nr:methyltransferase family protein [Aspergillus sclerotioniger CBS 115572]PWY94923.1 methyltransferase family protein [Aspergillus sclerotioniger CBS 115572]